jgi:hypothetical protein
MGEISPSALDVRSTDGQSRGMHCKNTNSSLGAMSRRQSHFWRTEMESKNCRNHS